MSATREWLDKLARTENCEWTEGAYASLEAIEAAAEARGYARGIAEADAAAYSALGNPTPQEWPNVRDGESFNGGVLRAVEMIRALSGRETP
jgi:hypothetical protein